MKDGYFYTLPFHVWGKFSVGADDVGFGSDRDAETAGERTWKQKLCSWYGLLMDVLKNALMRLGVADVFF